MSSSVFPVPFSGIQQTLIDAKGDLIVGSAADNAVRVAVGTDNQILVADSSTTSGVKWSTPASGGAIKQIVYGASTSSTSASGSGTSTVVDVTGLTATITPASTSSKIWVSMWMNANHNRTTEDRAQGVWRLLRNGTEISNSSSRPEHLVIIGPSGEMYTSFVASIDHVDSPSTTSATTYKIQYNGTGAGDEQYTLRSGAHILLMEI